MIDVRAYARPRSIFASPIGGTGVSESHKGSNQLPFPKQADLAGIQIQILGPHVWVEQGKWHWSHTDVIAEYGGVTFLAPVAELNNVTVTPEEAAQFQKAVEATFPDVERLARVLTGQN